MDVFHLSHSGPRTLTHQQRRFLSHCLSSLLLMAMLTACASQPPPVVDGGPIADDPIDHDPIALTIRLAAEHPEGVPVSLTMRVRGTGEGQGAERGYIFLNSESDYRDPRSLNIKIAPDVAARLRYERDFVSADTLQGETVQVSGLAERVRISFYCRGQQTNSYYYQTHILVDDPSQLTFLDRSMSG